MREILIKTFNNLKYAINFLEKGEMLFRHVDYFRKIEDGNIRGDVSEGFTRNYLNVDISEGIEIINLHSEVTGVTVPFNWKEYQAQHPKLKGETKIRLQLDYISQIQIYCMTFIHVSMTNIDKILFEIQKFGKHSVVVADENARQFVETLKNSGSIEATGFVKYIDNPDKPSPFIKPKLYENQSEFRMIRHANNESETKLYIGKIDGELWRTSSLRGLKKYLS